jgi:GrpB-like predicted nucleotidyltransferase (UPF0157 family)
MTEPAWAYERVEVVAYDPAWRDRAARDVEDIAKCLSGWLVTPVEHIGSTAVPGLPAKPIIDLMVAVDSFAVVPKLDLILRPIGWHLVPPELDQRQWRRFFVKVVNDRRHAHLHVMVEGDPRWTEQVLFRDVLRSNPALRDDYARLKLALADQHAGDREAYTAAKADFIEGVLQIAKGTRGLRNDRLT